MFLMAYCFLKGEKFGLAYNLFMRCIDIHPLKSEPWNNAGMCHQETWNLDDAERCFRKSLELEPGNQAAMANLALIAINRCQPEEALKWIGKAGKVAALNWEALDNKALALLMKRDWKEGWECYRATAGYQKQRPIKKYATPDEPDWNGEPGNVVLYSTQGLGDEISFASCIPDAIQKASITLDCDPRLEGLFRRSFPEAKVYGTRFKDEIPWSEQVDYSLAFDCLPQMFRNRTEDFPGASYLKADPERRIQWNALLKSYGKPAIGIAWTGGLATTGSKKRSLSLEDIAPILKSVDATWVALEYKDRTEDIREFEAKHGIKIHQWERAVSTMDYDDTAGLVAELDLVITVCTAVVHLSGALGKECWCLVPSKPRWWYGISGDDVPWYRSVKLFRQKQSGPWPIDEVKKLLRLRFCG